MPELPEVETVVRDLQKKVVGATITDMWTDWPKAIKDPRSQSKTTVSRTAVAYAAEQLKGKKILSVSRRGKNIVFTLSHGHLLLIHQKMTGHLLVGQWRIKEGRVFGLSPKAVVEDSYNHHVHFILSLNDGRQLGLSDVRKFAKILFGPAGDIETLPELTGLGPDALDPTLTDAVLSARLQAQRRPIKQVLMDPSVVAGIGNIYADDILWKARIHPLVSARSLTEGEIRKIHQSMREVLTLAVELRGTSTSDFRDTDGLEGNYTGHRAVYQRTGEPCPRCQTPIKRIVIAGRSAHLCPHCQKAPRGLLARTTSR